MVKIYIDPGHGGNDPGAISNGLSEKNLTLQIGHFLSDYLNKNYQDVSVQMSRTKDETVSLAERTNKANNWGADLYLSIHVNAGGGNGFESYIFNGQFANQSRTKQLRAKIHDTIISEMNWNDRGKKQANFHVLRETKMAAVLTESGFIDHQQEARLMRDNDWLKNVATSHAKGVAQAFNLKETSQPLLDDPLYRVVVGSFLVEKNAREKVDLLKEKGYESYIFSFAHQNKRYYRVIAGAFRQRENANRRVSDLKKDGFESFIFEV